MSLKKTMPFLYSLPSYFTSVVVELLKCVVNDTVYFVSGTPHYDQKLISSSTRADRV